MNAGYTIRFLHILASVVIAGLLIFLLPQAEIPSYLTIFLSLLLSFLFITIQTSTPQTIGTEPGVLKSIMNLLSQSYSIFFILLMLGFLIFIFSSYKHKIYATEPPQEFVTLKWISYVLLVFQIGLLFMFLMNEVKDKLASSTGNTMQKRFYDALMKNGKVYINLLTLLNSFITLALYIVIAKFTTDG
jgi:hypothetical protein